MKKRIIISIVALCVMLMLVPLVSRAAVMPYFVAVNDVLLPYSDDTMPFIVGNDIFVSVSVFERLNIWPYISENMVRVILYRGVDRYLTFDTVRRVTENQDGNILQWPTARRVDGRIYVPLRQVCDYFGMSFSYIDVPSNIISSEQVRLVRIVTDSVINDPTFMSINTTVMRNAYNAYQATRPTPPLPTPTETPSPGITPPPPEIEPPPDYSDVTIHISYFDILDESIEAIMNFLDLQADSGYYSAFFVKAGEIADAPDLIRRIAGSGHIIGAWLDEGTFEEYLEISEWLFEAAKIKTVLISSGDASQIAMETADLHGLIFWEGVDDMTHSDELSIDDIIPMFPTESGAARNIMLPCSENTAYILPGIYSYLRANQYTLTRITETSRLRA